MKKYFLIAAAVLFPVMTYAQGNSQWRGENRDGVYNETGLLKEWGAAGPDMLWVIEGLGDGYSSPAIANGKIYITGLKGRNLVLFVIQHGRLQNSKVIGAERTQQYPGPRSTVAVNEGKLYIYNAMGNLWCLNEETLDVLWSKDMFKDFDGRNIRWGVNESPLIVGDKIIMTPGGRRHNVVALNKNTGELIWTSRGMGNESTYCSPLFVDGYEVPMIVTSTERDIIALNANTGALLWSHRQTNTHNIHPNTPLYYNGMILSTTGYRGGTILLRLINNGKGVEQVWKHEMDNQMGGVVKVGDYIYASGHQNRFWYCIDWNTGKTMYREREIAPSNVIYADGMLYCYSERGTVFLVKPNPEKLDIVSSFRVTRGTGEHWAHPVIQNGVLYIRQGDALMAYRIR